MAALGGAQTLRGSTNGILSGVTNFYNQEKFIAARNRDGHFPLCDEQTLNSAFEIVLYALDADFPQEAEALHPPLFGGQMWFRTVSAILAAVGRGMIRSTPVQLKAAADKPLNMKDAFFELAPEILPPKSDGEPLQCLAEQIAGLVNFRNDLNLDANPYYFFERNQGEGKATPRRWGRPPSKTRSRSLVGQPHSSPQMRRIRGANG